MLSVQVETTDDYDEYCHYVAGLVGLGLSKLFHASGAEKLAPDNLSNSMGLFLQVCVKHTVIQGCCYVYIFYSLFEVLSSVIIF